MIKFYKGKLLSKFDLEIPGQTFGLRYRNTNYIVKRKWISDFIFNDANLQPYIVYQEECQELEDDLFSE